MTISSFHVQHILKAYSQQLSVRARTPKEKVPKNMVQKDEVTLSQESKKMLIVDKIIREIIFQLAEGSERNDTGQEILNQLSEEYGRPLDVASNNGDGVLFKVLSEPTGGTMEYLPPEENEQLKKRLYDIAQSIVYQQLI